MAARCAPSRIRSKGPAAQISSVRPDLIRHKYTSPYGHGIRAYAANKLCIAHDTVNTCRVCGMATAGIEGAELAHLFFAQPPATIGTMYSIILHQSIRRGARIRRIVRAVSRTPAPSFLARRFHCRHTSGFVSQPLSDTGSLRHRARRTAGRIGAAPARMIMHTRRILFRRASVRICAAE
jgi:hypothetical protein